MGPLSDEDDAIHMLAGQVGAEHAQRPSPAVCEAAGIAHGTDAAGWRVVLDQREKNAYHEASHHVAHWCFRPGVGGYVTIVPGASFDGFSLAVASGFLTDNDIEHIRSRPRGPGQSDDEKVQEICRKL